jgi:hypothetical protein
MAGLTITEALAEIKTIGKRINSKREFVQGYLYRQEGLKDPLEKDGGSAEVIRRERQAINDLALRIIKLRRGIQHANDTTEVHIGTNVMTIADWLTWRRDVMPEETRFLTQLRARLGTMRDQAKRAGANVLAGASAIVQTDVKATDVIVNLDEGELAHDIEEMEEIVGTLDGQLSLKNATVMIEIDP